MTSIATQPIRNARTLVSILVFALGVGFALSHKQERFAVGQVAVEDARRMIERGAIVVDVRGSEAYATRHVPGAISIPIGQLRDGVPVTIASATEREIVVYCNDGVTTGPEGTQILNRAGFSRAVNMTPGIEGWTRAGLPTAQ